MLADQMGEDFGVGLRAKLVSRLSKPFLDPVEVFNHTVVNDGDPAGPVEVRMGVLVRRRAVCSPAGVADAKLTGCRLGLEGSAKAFVDFMSQRGLVYEQGRYIRDQVYDPLFIFGLPVTGAYWVKVGVGGIERPILFQVFERRVLTYNPANPAGWRVEMGNVGRHYFEWRYGYRP